MSILLPLSWLYAGAVLCRNFAFDRGIFRAHDAGVPVISVGNLTAGGTGKTPLAEYIARYLRERNVRVAIVSRGYRRASRGVVVVSDGREVHVDAREGGDEPVQMALKLVGVPVIVGERRIDAARCAVTKLGAEAIVLDDGFQHRSIRRNLDILVMDANKDITLERMLPAGMRREPLRALHRADMLAYSRAGRAVRWDRKAERWSTAGRILYRYESPSARRVVGRAPVPLATLRGKPVFAFSGIGDHQGFVQSLRVLGLNVVGERRFPDHHSYSVDDLQANSRMAGERAAKLMVTTEKDAVRLTPLLEGMKGSWRQGMLVYIPVRVVITQGEEILANAIDRCVPEGSP